MRQNKALLLAVLCAATFMGSLDLFIFNVGLRAICPDVSAATLASAFYVIIVGLRAIGHDVGATSLASLSWVLNAYAIVFAALLVPAGRWADRTGRKRAFLIGMSLFTVASAACAAAPSIGVLIGARVVQAAGAALLMPTSLGLLLPEFPPHERATAIGVWAAVGGIAAATGPPLGGLLVAVSWRLVFIVNLPIGIAAGF